MLLFRSIPSISICILTISIFSARCQYYDSDYHANVESEDDHSSSNYNNEDHRPDYSKYYSGGSAPLLSSTSGDVKESEHGFVSPLDFSGFFGAPSHFSAENKAQSNPVIPIQNPFLAEEGEAKSAGFVNAQDFQAGFGGSSLEFSPSNFEGSFNNEPKLEQTKTAPNENKFAPKKKSYKAKKYKSEVDDLNGNYKTDTYKKPAVKSSYEKSLDYVPPKYDNYAPLPTKSNLYNPIVPTLSSYTPAGTINQLSPVKTYVPQYFPVKHTNAPLQTTLPSYQSIQSAGSLGLPSLDNIKSTLAPFNPNPTQYSSFNQPKEFAQPSEYSSQQVKGSKCQKIAKQVSPDDISHGRFRRQADKMNCYLCTDPKSGGSYEQCSYTSDPENDGSYFRGHAEKYSTKTYSDPENYRSKRSTNNKERRNKQKRNENNEELEHYSNPFNYEKDNSHKLNSKPQEFDDSSYYKAPDFSHYEKDSESYRFGPEYFTDSSNNEKSYSELQSEELKKNGENCKKIKKDSMTCMVCTNPKTGGNYEQCSYTAEPKEKKYAYVKEKKYNSNDPDPEEKTVESTESKPTIQRNKSRYQPRKIENLHEFSASTKHPKQTERDDKEDYSIPSHFSASTKHSKHADSDAYTIPHHFIDDAKAEIKSRFHSNLNGEPTENRKSISNRRNSEKEREDYVYKLFPEYAEKESKNQEIKRKPGFEFHSDLPEYFTAEESKKDVDSVLQEFSKKDRSKCKKIAKDKMTCYICQDDKGVQHEECMFVSESQPKSSHIAYHEVKEFSTDPKNQHQEEETADTKQSTEKTPLSDASVIKQKRKAFPKKVAPIALKDVDVEPVENIKITGTKSPRIFRRKTNINKDLLGSTAQESRKSEVKVKRSENSKDKEEEHSAEAEEIQEPETENADGAYASELKPIYSEKLGMTLPAYMLAISEGEKIFDEAVGAER